MAAFALAIAVSILNFLPTNGQAIRKIPHILGKLETGRNALQKFSQGVVQT